MEETTANPPPQSDIAADPERAFGAWCIIVVGAALANFTGIGLTVVTGSNIVACAVLGCIVAQWCLAAVWGVFGPGRWFVRWPVATVSTAAILGFGFIGLLASGPFVEYFYGPPFCLR